MGESLALAAAFGWVGSSVFLERASKETGTLAVNLIRLIIALLFLGVIMYVKRGLVLPLDVTKESLKFLSISGLFGLFLGDFFYINHILK